jgi:hypothetical protein
MTTYTKRPLSGSTNGRPIKVVQTATPGTLIHTAVAGTDDNDEIWLWARNGHTAAVVLTLEWGGVSVPDDVIVNSVPIGAGLFLQIPGWILQNGLIVRAFAATGNVITLGGYVNRVAA